MPTPPDKCFGVPNCNCVRNSNRFVETFDKLEADPQTKREDWLRLLLTEYIRLRCVAAHGSPRWRVAAESLLRHPIFGPCWKEYP